MDLFSTTCSQHPILSRRYLSLLGIPLRWTCSTSVLGEGLRSPPASSNGQEHHGKSLAANVVMRRGVIGRLAPAPARQIPIWKLGMLLFAETRPHVLRSGSVSTAEPLIRIGMWPPRAFRRDAISQPDWISELLRPALRLGYIASALVPGSSWRTPMGLAGNGSSPSILF